MDNKVEFTEEAIKEYLDKCIIYWRDKKEDTKLSEESRKMRAYYIDAFQSVRVSIFGELLQK